MDLIYPRICPVCGETLMDTERHICTSCQYALPRTRFRSFVNNPVADRLAGKVRFEKAVAAFHYQKESSIQILFEQFKYHSDKQLASYLGAMAGQELQEKHFFDGMDVIVPLPLHKNKYRQRGYNQSEWIARGLSFFSGLPVDTQSVIRSVENPTQTDKNLWERKENVEGVFTVLIPENLHGKHLLVVDDVLTTGATMDAMGTTLHNALKDNPEYKVSFFTLALA